jgi:hypothetical protein
MRNVRALPRWRAPVGEGASRVRGFGGVGEGEAVGGAELRSTRVWCSESCIGALRYTCATRPSRPLLLGVGGAGAERIAR